MRAREEKRAPPKRHPPNPNNQTHLLSASGDWRARPLALRAAELDLQTTMMRREKLAGCSIIPPGPAVALVDHSHGRARASGLVNLAGSLAGFSWERELMRWLG
jgi:hypothetical protein